MSAEIPVHSRAPALPTLNSESRAFQLADAAVLGAVLLAAFGQLMIKAGLSGIHSITASRLILERLAVYFEQPLVILGIIVYALGTVLWIFAVSKRDISYVFPISALNYALVAVGGKYFFAEVIPPTRWIGIAVVAVGVALMQITGRAGSR